MQSYYIGGKKHWPVKYTALGKNGPRMEKKQPTPRFERQKLTTVNCFTRLIDRKLVRPEEAATDIRRPSVEVRTLSACSAGQ